MGERETFSFTFSSSSFIFARSLSLFSTDPEGREGEGGRRVRPCGDEERGGLRGEIAGD